MDVSQFLIGYAISVLSGLGTLFVIKIIDRWKG